MEGSVSKTKKARTNKNNQGSFAMIPKTSLYVDHSYQRDARSSRVSRISKDWDWVQFGAISVSQRLDNSYFVIDGQHRHQAAMMRDDIDELPCMVFDMANTSDEARGYLSINTMKSAPTMAERFRVMVKLGEDKEAVKLQELAIECGREIDGQTRSHSIGCIARILYHMKAYPEAFDRAWPVILDVCEGKGLNGRIVEGIVWLEHNLADGKSLSHSSYRRILCSIGYDELVNQIAQTVKYEDRSGMTVWGMGILKALNRRLQKKLDIKR